MTCEKRRKKSFIDELFRGSIFEEMEEFFKEFPQDEFTSSYSISVTKTPEGTKVKAKVGRDMDVDMLRKNLEQQYPGAQIQIEGGREPLIKEVSTRAIHEEENSGKQKKPNSRK